MRPLSGKELARLLEQHGWEIKRVTGSHHIYCKTGSAVRLSVPIHGSKALGEGLLKHLLKMSGIPEEAV